MWSHDVPVAFAGISSGCEGHLQSAGTPWFLTANGFRAAWRPFLRRLKPEFDAAKGCYSFLGNYVHEHNRLGIHLVNHLGFTLGDHLSIGFRRFWWWKESENNV